MTNRINDLGGSAAAREWEARSGAFVNDTAPGMDGSVLGVNTVPASTEVTSQQFALTNRQRGRGRSLIVAALGGGLFALSLFLRGRARTRRAPRFGSFLFPKRRSLFAR